MGVLVEAPPVQAVIASERAAAARKHRRVGSDRPARPRVRLAGDRRRARPGRRRRLGRRPTAAALEVASSSAALIGTPKRIRERYQVWADCDIVTGLHIGTQQPAAVELMAEIALAEQPVAAR